MLLVRVRLIGFDPILDRPLRDWQVEKVDHDQSYIWIELLSEPYTLIMSQFLAEKYQHAEGGLSLLEHIQQKSAFRVIVSLP